MLTEREAAAMLTMSTRKLWELRNRGEVPCIRFDRCVRYDPADLRRWIESRKSAS
ncbi:MAG: helix-turn-helix domain-containing protein [Phycisphaerales bacterium]